MSNACESCCYFEYDDEYDDYICTISMDEDEIGRYLSGADDFCRYYRPYDEYGIVRKQN